VRWLIWGFPKNSRFFFGDGSIAAGNIAPLMASVMAQGTLTVAKGRESLRRGGCMVQGCPDPKKLWNITIFHGKITIFYGKITCFFMENSRFFTGKSQFLLGKSTISMVIFNSKL